MGETPESKSKKGVANVDVGNSHLYTSDGEDGRNPPKKPLFSTKEKIHLVRAWVKHSALVCNQIEEIIWCGIESIFRTKFGIDRSCEAIREKGNVLQRECKNFIATRASVASKLPSGGTVE